MLSFRNTCLPTGKKGFTLIELLIVIVVIALLSTMVMINIGGVTSKGRDSRRTSDLKQISTALELYFQDNNSYPLAAGVSCLSSDTCWSTLLDAGVGGPKKYMPLVPKDPKNASPKIYKYCKVNDTKFVVVGTLENDIPSAQQLGTNADCEIPGALVENVFWMGN